MKLVPDITDYKLEFMTQKYKNSVVKFWSGKITEFLRQFWVILFDSIESKISHKNFSMICRKNR